MTFTESDKKVSGYTGCNNFSGPVSIQGSTLSFDQPLSTTRKFCRGDGETSFLNALKTVTAWAVTDNTTLALIAGDKISLRFAKRL